MAGVLTAGSGKGAAPSSFACTVTAWLAKGCAALVVGANASVSSADDDVLSISRSATGLLTGAAGAACSTGAASFNLLVLAGNTGFSNAAAALDGDWNVAVMVFIWLCSILAAKWAALATPSNANKCMANAIDADLYKLRCESSWGGGKSVRLFMAFIYLVKMSLFCAVSRKI
jgi:hypothetical protein